ncbi:MAG: AzlC family ABC transporter permease [Lachnospiraceae bacterium]|nr:AzlC family ABC transporter permease [Lachnospiraceae bacterium]
MKEQKKSTYFIKGMRDGIPIAMGYLAVAFTLGISAKNANMTGLQAAVMSVTMHASAGEFAAISMIATNAGILEMIFTEIIVNLRYILLSCSLSQKLDAKMPFFHRFFLAFDMTDEVFGISMASAELSGGKLHPYYTYGAMAVASPGWVLGTFLGVVLGNVLPISVLNALNVALYGMFLAIIIPAAKKNKIILGLIIVTMLASSLFAVLPVVRELSSGIRIIILTLLIAGAAAFLFPIKETEVSANE